MAQKHLTSPDGGLSEYKQGVKYELITYNETTEIDEDTANKLSQAILGNPDVKFVKIDTTHGKHVVAISDIKRIKPNQDRAEAIVKSIRTLLENAEDKSYEGIAIATQAMLRRSLSNGKDLGPEMSKAEFDYFYNLVKPS